MCVLIVFRLWVWVMVCGVLVENWKLVGVCLCYWVYIVGFCVW